MGRYLLVPVVYCMVLLATGCTVTRVTVNNALHPEDVTFIVPGQTTFAKVIDHLGVPDSLSPLEAGMVATYYFLDVRYSRLNLGLIARFWSPVDPDLIFAAGGLGSDMFQVQFDGNGVASASSFAYHTYKRGFNPWPFSRGTPTPPPQEDARN